ncbi:ESF1 homolog isoform X2 [Arapaima gigas]
MASKNAEDGDNRFLRVKKDPRFWEMPEKERKIKIDKRFQSMFHDERFKLKYTVDKRGRPISHSTTEDLKRFYQLSDSELSETEKEQAEDKQKKKKKKKKSKQSTVPTDAPHPGEEAEEEAELGAGEKITTEESSQTKATHHFQGVKVYKEGESSVLTVRFTCHNIEEEALDSGAGLSEQGESGSEDESEDEDEESSSDLEEESEDEGATSSEEESEEDSDSGPDLARGKGNIETSSDEEDDADEVDRILRQEEEEIAHDWGEMWKDTPRSDLVTRRLAVCNMEWDRLKAKDLLALLSSFKPEGGFVLSVKIYPSEFGKERMKLEQVQGPLELISLPEDPEDDTEEERVYREKMRDYQIKRMRYYYAIVECNSPETAAKIYDECDGYEYESSCSMLDLRFIPDDVTFDDEPKDVAADVDLATYTPKYFTSTALATSKVELTWDETDHERVTTLKKKFKKDEILDMDFQAYLASSSEDDEEEPDAEDHDEEGLHTGGEKTKKLLKSDAEQIAKYRELLKSINDKEQKAEDKAMEMEVTWVPGLKEATEQLVKKKLEGKAQLTPWEEFLQKKKEKKKQKRAKAIKRCFLTQASAESSLSDEELPPDVDLNDPYFAEELGNSGSAVTTKAKSRKAKKAMEEQRTPEEEEELERQRAEMALLMDEEEEDGKRKHFNYDKIVEHQNLSKKKKKKLIKKNELLEEDDFQVVDLKDPRFQAMFTSHLYNLDPSDPSYKKTKATQRILEEKQRRREEQQRHQEEAVKRKLQEMDQEEDAREKPAGAKKAMDPGLSMLIKSIKSKTEQFQAKKKQKTK